MRADAQGRRAISRLAGSVQGLRGLGHAVNGKRGRAGGRDTGARRAGHRDSQRHVLTPDARGGGRRNRADAADLVHGLDQVG